VEVDRAEPGRDRLVQRGAGILHARELNGVASRPQVADQQCKWFVAMD